MGGSSHRHSSVAAAGSLHSADGIGLAPASSSSSVGGGPGVGRRYTHHYSMERKMGDAGGAGSSSLVHEVGKRSDLDDESASDREYTVPLIHTASHARNSSGGSLNSQDGSAL